MEATRRKAAAPGERHKLPTTPCYLLRPDADGGIQWIAAAKDQWRLPDGRPAIETIANAAGVTPAHMWRIKAAPATPPGNKLMAGLVNIAAQAHGTTRDDALARICWFFDPADRADVAQLEGYLAPELETAAA